MNYKIQLQGLHCESCKKITEKRIGNINGVISIEVDLQNQTGNIVSTNTISKNDIENVLKDTDYKILAIQEI
jgi:copper chaperone CopZ